jgi:hypothetical protein
MGQVVEHLSSKHEALGCIHSTARKKQKKKGKTKPYLIINSNLFLFPSTNIEQKIRNSNSLICRHCTKDHMEE